MVQVQVKSAAGNQAIDLTKVVLSKVDAYGLDIISFTHTSSDMSGGVRRRRLCSVGISKGRTLLHVRWEVYITS